MGAESTPPELGRDAGPESTPSGCSLPDENIPTTTTSFNDFFRSTLTKLKFPINEETMVESAEVVKQVNDDRKYVIEAAIVR